MSSRTRTASVAVLLFVLLGPLGSYAAPAASDETASLMERITQAVSLNLEVLKSEVSLAAARRALQVIEQADSGTVSLDASRIVEQGSRVISGSVSLTAAPGHSLQARVDRPQHDGDTPTTIASLSAAYALLPVRSSAQCDPAWIRAFHQVSAAEKACEMAKCRAAMDVAMSLISANIMSARVAHAQAEVTLAAADLERQLSSRRLSQSSDHGVSEAEIALEEAREHAARVTLELELLISGLPTPASMAHALVYDERRLRVERIVEYGENLARISESSALPDNIAVESRSIYSSSAVESARGELLAAEAALSRVASSAVPSVKARFGLQASEDGQAHNWDCRSELGITVSCSWSAIQNLSDGMVQASEDVTRAQALLFASEEAVRAAVRSSSAQFVRAIGSARTARARLNHVEKVLLTLKVQHDAGIISDLELARAEAGREDLYLQLAEACAELIRQAMSLDALQCDTQRLEEVIAVVTGGCTG